jgi:alpha-tubulin suppressor-like RCC1 family protein
MIILPGMTTVLPGGGFTCGVAYAVAYCWGDGAEYELGTGDLASRAAPARVWINAFASAISAGYNHACLLTTDSLAYCWGRRGGLGYPYAGSASPRPSPVSGGLRFVAVVTGYHSTCGLGSDSLAYCWGETPLAVPGGHKFLQLAHGYDHECGITTDSLAYCWGTNAFGQLGNGTTSVSEASPVAVAGSLKLVSIAAGGEFTCGVAADGSGYCWGKNNTGQLGAQTSPSCGGTACSMVPALVSGGFAWKQIVAGRYHACGLSLSGVAYCWGLNDLGQVGDGTTTPRMAPTRVAGQP